MGFTSEACAIIRQRTSHGKRCVVIADDDNFVRILTQDRTSLGVTGRVNVAFLTPEEYRQWQQARKHARGSCSTAAPGGDEAASTMEKMETTG